MKWLIMAGIIFYILILFLNSAYAASPWLCTENAAERQGDKTIVACGIGFGKNEALAREDASDRARREFLSTCEQSVECRGYETIVTPLRSECDQFNGEARCFRGYRYEITDTKKPVEPKPVASIVSAVSPSNHSSESESESPIGEQDWRLLIGLGYAGDSASSYNSAPGFFCCGSVALALKHKVFWIVSIAFQYDLKVGKGQLESELGPIGEATPNTVRNFATSSSAHEFAVSVPLEFSSNWYLSPELGRSFGSFTVTQRAYNSQGQGIWNGGISASSYQTNFFGGNVSWISSLRRMSKASFGWYGNLGFRKYLNSAYSGNTALNFAFGLQFGL